MNEKNRAYDWKKIADIYHKNKIHYWKQKPRFRIGEIVVVKQKAQSVTSETLNSRSWGKLVAQFDKCREPLRGKEAIVINITYDKDFLKHGCAISYRIRCGRKEYSMCEEWLKKRK